LREGAWGLCKNRFAKEGKLYVATYGLLSAAESRENVMPHFAIRLKSFITHIFKSRTFVGIYISRYLSYTIIYNSIYQF